MPAPLFATDADSCPIYMVDAEGFEAWQATADPQAVRWASETGYGAKPGQSCLLPGSDGRLVGVLHGVSQSPRRPVFQLAEAVRRLPEAAFHVARAPHWMDLDHEALGWLLESYSYSHASARPSPLARLKAQPGPASERAERLAAGAVLARDLINTPANLMGPDALEAAFRALGAGFNADVSVVVGDDLLAQNFPLIHTVGRAADQAPRLLDLHWGPADAPKVTLVGKGICFDTGGLNLKPGAAMGLMKKDMGGAANAMGLAQMIMALDLPVRLRLLVPVAENAVSAGAFRPGDILTSRKGLTVEVNNTDAEGRLVLADALALADEDAPDQLYCFATLTGAARVALGADLPAMFAQGDGWARTLQEAGRRVGDPVWELPFWDGYEGMIEPGIADVDNAPAGGFGGAITAALFLRRFVEKAPRFAHFDLYGWSKTARPGCPKGGAAQAIRAVLAAIEDTL
ncbi:MAG: leucyl aminopeptidase family protein [Pseudomonadota bacterium]